MLTRRGLITGLISFVAAPAIVRVSSIMPVRPVKFVAGQTDQFLKDGIIPFPSTDDLLQEVFDRYAENLSRVRIDAFGSWGGGAVGATFMSLKPQAQRDAGNCQGDQE
jgi:hypothetical protein